MHAIICKLDMILLMSNLEPISEPQLNHLRKVLRDNEQLYQRVWDSIELKSIYIRRYPRYLMSSIRLEAIINVDINIAYKEQLHAFMKFCRNNTKQYNHTQPTPTVYKHILEAHRIQQTYIKQSPSHRNYANAHLFDEMDFQIDESQTNYIFTQLAKNQRIDESRVLFLYDYLRRRFTHILREITERNGSTQTTIRNYSFMYNRKNNRAMTHCRTRSPMKEITRTRTHMSNYFQHQEPQSTKESHNKLYNFMNFRKQSTEKQRAETPSNRCDTFQERRSNNRSIYQIKRVQLLEDMERTTVYFPQRKVEARTASRCLIKTRYQSVNSKLNQTMKLLSKQIEISAFDLYK